MKKVSVIGAGSWGSALAVLLANNGHEVTLWSHDSKEIEGKRAERQASWSEASGEYKGQRRS